LIGETILKPDFTRDTNSAKEKDMLMSALKEACGVIDLLQTKLHAANVPCGDMDEIIISRAYYKIQKILSGDIIR
jgi:hypothetical protein